MAARFIGEVNTQWMQQTGDDRRIWLIQGFTFVIDIGKTRTARAGSVIDGASIPEISWSTEDSPFVGEYQRASVLHGVYCQLRTEPDTAVHRMFCGGLRCVGVGTFTVKKMYAAVRRFGPRSSLGGDAATIPDSAGSAGSGKGLAIDDLERVLDHVVGN